MKSAFEKWLARYAPWADRPWATESAEFEKGDMRAQAFNKSVEGDLWNRS